MRYGQVSFTDEEKALLNGCARFVLWSFAALVYLFVLVRIARKFGRYETSATVIGFGVMFLGMAALNAPFVHAVQYRFPWSSLRDHPDREDPLLGRAFYAVIGLFAVLIGVIMAFNV